jgi:trk system potassium uptake protein
MKVIICGAGQVGSSIARQLALEDNDVTIIDLSEELIGRIGESMEVQTVLGHASHPDVLNRAAAADADMLIAVTSSDETNMVACQIAHSLFRIPMRVARIRHQSYLNPQWKDLYRLEHLPIDVIISPEIEVAEAIIRRLHVPGAADMIPYADGKLKVIAVHCQMNCPVINLPMHVIRQRTQNLKMRIMGIVHAGHFHIPTDNMILSPGDEVYFVADDADVRRSMALFGHEEKAARRICIIGGGNIGLYIAQQLEQEDHGLRIKLIEYDRARAEEVAALLENTTVICGDGLNQEVLLEANVNLAETVIGVTNDDEVNVLSCLLAKRTGCQRAITLVNNASYVAMLGNLGIDVTVNPRETTVSTILQHIRRGKIRGVHTIHDGAAEIIEAEAVETSPLIGKSLSMIELPKDIMIGAILRDGAVVIPNDSTIIEENDRIIILATTKAVKKVEQIFSVRLEFF